MLKTVRDIFDTARLIIQARRQGHRGDFLLLTDDCYRALLKDRKELFDKTLVLWDIITDIGHGGSACDYCMFNQDIPCPEAGDRGCAEWCLRDPTEEESV